MKQIVYRMLAGLIVIAAGYAAFRAVSERDFNSGFDFGIVGLILGFLLIVPTFTAYALFGEKAGNRVMTPLVKLLNLPDALWHRFVDRYVEIPHELEPTHEKPTTSGTGNKALASDEVNPQLSDGHF